MTKDRIKQNSIFFRLIKVPEETRSPYSRMEEGYRQIRPLFAKSGSTNKSDTDKYCNRLYTFSPTTLKSLDTNIKGEAVVEIPAVFLNTNPQYRKAKNKNTLFRCGKFDAHFSLYTFPLWIFS